ncbi:leucine-rich repeat extensin-like protein 3 [Cornus florida]|uniref:leucine-rich repeat extensin-like protein 3 n=1 Tax=Cornus florida TaxID=4283 RepID=UPI00289F43C3|nr:leucine-rich repeat extensin-like protein 3 [Cornus florida]
MERFRSGCTRLCILAVCISILATTNLTLCEARTLLEMFEFRGQEFHTSSAIDAINDVKVSNDELNMNPAISNDELDGISYPFSLVPFESLGPLPSPEDTPPFCVFPPIFTPHPPPNSYGQPSPTPPFYFPPFPNQTPPPQGHTPTPPTPVHSNPSPPNPVQNPPHSVPTPSPPHHGPSPPKQAHSPPKHGPSPPVYLPPVPFPPPYGPPPPHKRPDFAVWCVAKPTVPDTIIQEAMDYACGSGADCKSIQPNGPCFKPNTVIAHASYAFNSYWQRTKVAGGTCDFGGSAMIVTVDPSFDGCQFIFN